MRATTWIAVGLLAAMLLFGATGCILDEKAIELVFKNVACVDFEEYHESEVFTTPETVDVADDIDDALADQGLTRADILEANLLGATYQVTDFDTEHDDWEISGSITVRRVDISDGPDTILVYTSQSIEAAMPDPVFATLHADGVGLFNRALDDYIGGSDPILEFSVNNGDVEPDPDGDDPLVFDWRACLKMYVIVDEEYEVPDVFGG